MAEYISMDAAVKAIQYRVCQGQGNKEHICKRGSCAYCGIMEIITDISSIQAADVQPVDRWISVKDRLPEEQQCILVHEKDYGVMLGDYQGIKYSQPVWIVRKQGLIMRTTEVTHWQPLPEPPKDGDAE